MSKTRRSANPDSLSQEKYLSHPDFAELRPISGLAVTARAELLRDPAQRSLLFWLQAMSTRPGGLREFVRQFLAALPERIGTPTTLRLAKKGVASFSPEVTAAIWSEFDKQAYFQALNAACCDIVLIGEDEKRETVTSKHPAFGVSTPQDWSERFLDHAPDLERWLVEFAINPGMKFPAQTDGRKKRDDAPAPASFPWIHDIIGALFEFKQRQEKEARTALAMTQPAKLVFEALDLALQDRKMLVVQGEAGIGKTTAVEAWCSIHQGEARFITLSGITHRTGIFRLLARELGIGGGNARSSTEIQTRAEEILHRSGLMLVIDEAHFLFGASERVYSRPELVDWIDTALFNHRVPVALICTPQFTSRMARTEQQTTWNADQFRRRVRRFVELPMRPRKEDLYAVAGKLLPQAGKNALDFIVGHTLLHDVPFSALSNAFEEARLIARQAGREQIIFEDVKRAIVEYCEPSLAAMKAALAPRPPRRRGPAPGTPRASIGAPVVEPQTDRAGARSHTNLTGLAPAERLPGTRSDSAPEPRYRGEPVEA